MADKTLTYRISINVNDAKQQAAAVRAAFTAELRQIKIGTLDSSAMKSASDQAKQLTGELERASQAGRGIGQMDASGIQRAGTEAQRLRFELERAADAGKRVDISGALSGAIGQLPGIGSLGSSLVGGFAGGFAATAVISGVRELGQALDETARRGAVFSQLGDVLDDYASSVGSSSQAMIAAAKEAAQGTISQYELILNANRAIQFEVAKTPEAYAKLIELSTALGRAQGITDTQALEYITTGIARESRLILDNLGLIINLEDATNKYAESLGKSANELTTAERKQALLEEAFRQGATAIQANRDAAKSAATSYERLDANVQDLRDTFGKWLAEASASKIAALADAIYLVNRELSGERRTPRGIEEDIDGLIKMRDELQKGGSVSLFGVGSVQGNNAEMIDFLNRKIAESEEAKLRAAAATRELNDTNQQAAILSMQAANALTLSTVEMDKWREKQKAIAAEAWDDQKTEMGKGIASLAENLVGTVGAERAIALYKQAKADADEAVKALADAGVTDALEIQMRSAEIMAGITDVFAQVEDNAYQIDFSQMSSSLSNLNASFVDFLPGVAGAREELIELSAEMSYSGIVTDEQAARFEYLSAVAYSVADSGSQLNGIVNELGSQFLSTNAYAAELVNQMFLAEAAFRSGQISSGQYAGIMTILSGDLLEVARTAGVATNAINILNSAQADMSNLPGFGTGLSIGSNIAQRTQTQQAEMNREHNRREQERYAKEQERAAKSAAKQTESAAKKAAKELESGAKKAARELQSALQGVEGLFDPSQVSDEDMKRSKLGIYGDKADEYLRRLRDEVENGKDWADVSIEDAKAALERIGVVAGDTSKAILQQFEDAWASSALFSDKANLSFINKEAVQLQLDLQKKSEEGEKNIFEYFGIKVDEAVDAVTSGGGGSSYTPPEITPPNYIDVDPLTDGLQTGLDNYIQGSADAVQKGFEAATALFFDPASLFGKKSGTPGAMGPAEKPVITVTADESAQAFVPALTGQVQPMISFGVAQGPVPKPGQSGTQDLVLTPTIDDAALQAALDKITAKSLEVTAVLAANTGESIAMGLGDQLSKQTVTFLSHGDNIGKTLISGISAVMSPNAKGEAQIDIAGFLANNLNAQLDTFGKQGNAIADELIKGISSGSTPKVDASGEMLTPMITALIQNVNTQIRHKQGEIKGQGVLAGQYLMAGMTAYLSTAEMDAAGNAKTSLADALMTKASSQLTATSNMFYALGFIPAGDVESGFKAYDYTDMDRGILEGITVGIRSNADNYTQRGATIGSYVQRGLNDSFNSEVGIALAVAAGAAWGSAFQRGVLNQLGAGGGIVAAITDKVLDGIVTEMEQP